MSISVQKTGTALVALVLLLYASNMYSYAFEEGLWPLKPIFIHLLAVGLALWFVFQQREPLFFDVMPRAFAFWILAFMALLIVGYIASSQSSLVFRLTVAYMKFASIFAVAIVLMHTHASRRLAEYVFLCAALLAVAWYAVEILNYAHEVNGRARGTYKNPNFAGRMLIFCMLASFAVIPQRLRIPFVLLCGFGVLMTFSRSSILLWGASVAALFLIGSIGRMSVFKMVVGAASIFVAAAIVFGAASDVIQDSFLADYLDTGTQARMGIGSNTFSDWSFDGRVRAALAAADEFAAAPWFGHGLGSTREWSMPIAPHNTYLMVAAEGGLLALAVYALMIIICWNSTDRLGKIIVGLYAVSGMITHNNLDQLPNTIFLAYAARRGVELPGMVFRPDMISQVGAR